MSLNHAVCIAWMQDLAAELGELAKSYEPRWFAATQNKSRIGQPRNLARVFYVTTPGEAKLGCHPDLSRKDIIVKAIVDAQQLADAIGIELGRVGATSCPGHTLWNVLTDKLKAIRETYPSPSEVSALVNARLTAPKLAVVPPNTGAV